MASSSVLSWLISACWAAPSVVAVLAAETARSRTRCRMAWTSFSDPSAVCTKLTPSWALEMAWLVPPISARRLSDLTRPAASSAARLIRNPEDSFSRELVRASDVVLRLRYALNAMMFWLIRMLLTPPCSSRLGVATSRPQPRSDFRVGSLVRCSLVHCRRQRWGLNGTDRFEAGVTRRSPDGSEHGLGNRIHPTAV